MLERFACKSEAAPLFIRCAKITVLDKASQAQLGRRSRDTGTGDNLHERWCVALGFKEALDEAVDGDIVWFWYEWFWHKE